MKPSESDCSELPLCEGPPTDDVTNDEERRDDVAVLTSENGLSGSRSVNGKRSQYLLQPRLPKIKFTCRWRQGAVLGLGVFLTILALTLVVVGAVRSREHTSFKLLHIKQPVDLKSLMYLNDDNFTFGMERTPYWYVDLLSDKTVASVRIKGSSFNKLHDLNVYVGKTSNDTDTERKCGALTGESQTSEIRIACSRIIIGRYVIIELHTKADTYESLILCEVMVFH